VWREHPFTSGLGPGDGRITTRWDPSDLTVGLFAVFHEVGHGLYEQGLDAGQWGLPAGEQVSDGVDESQSRLWENVVGRSPGFWRFLWPELAVRFPALAAADPDRTYRAFNPRGGVAHPRRRRRGHLSPAHRRAHRPRAGAAARLSVRRRAPRRMD
jgi:Zn-dependent M32 family carboxypeptidase